MELSILLTFSALFTPIELLFHQAPQVPFHIAALHPGRSQHVLHSWIMFAQVQDLTLVLVKLHKVFASPFFQPIQVFLQDISPFQRIHFPTQFGVTDKLQLSKEMLLDRRNPSPAGCWTVRALGWALSWDGEENSNSRGTNGMVTGAMGVHYVSSTSKELLSTPTDERSGHSFCSSSLCSVCSPGARALHP